MEAIWEQQNSILIPSFWWTKFFSSHTIQAPRRYLYRYCRQWKAWVPGTVVPTLEMPRQRCGARFLSCRSRGYSEVAKPDFKTLVFWKCPVKKLLWETPIANSRMILNNAGYRYRNIASLSIWSYLASRVARGGTTVIADQWSAQQHKTGEFLILYDQPLTR